MLHALCNWCWWSTRDVACNEVSELAGSDIPQWPHHLLESRLRILADVCLANKLIKAVLHWCCVVSQLEVPVKDSLVVGV